MKITSNINVHKLNFNPKKHIIATSFSGNDSVELSTEAKKKPFTNLSKNVSIKPENKQFRIVSIPNDSKVIDGKIVSDKKNPSIAVIDLFAESSQVNLGSGIYAPHGTIVSKYATKDLEDKVGLLAFDTKTEDKETQFKAINEALQSLLEYQKEHKNIIALNLSVGENFLYETILDKTGLNLSSKNIEENKDVLLETLSKSNDERLKQAYSSILLINELVKTGVEIFIASGNANDIGLNLFSLSKAQHLVSASDYKHSNKSFATDEDKAVHCFKKTCDDSGKILCMTDGEIIIDANEVIIKDDNRSLFSKLLEKDSHKIKGTSYSSPLALNKYLKSTIF